MFRSLVRRGGIAVVGIVMLVGSVAVSYAAIPATNGVITACYNMSGNPSGAMRVIDAEAGAKCSKNEKTLTFNQTGPQGPQGIQGLPGEPGADGTDGINGTDGTNGVDGTDGTDGAPGAPGPAGPAGISTATFAISSNVTLNEVGFTKVTGKTLPMGSWVVVATANISSVTPFDGDVINTLNCELRSGANVIGYAIDRRVIPDADTVDSALAMNGGTAVPDGGIEVSLWCASQLGGERAAGQLMFLQIGGFS